MFEGYEYICEEMSILYNRLYSVTDCLLGAKAKTSWNCNVAPPSAKHSLIFKWSDFLFCVHVITFQAKQAILEMDAIRKCQFPQN